MKLAGRIVAHRGLARIRPENTRAAVLAALDAGLRRVEIDVQLSADGVPVVHHDADLARLCARAGDLRRLRWAQLARLSCHEPGRFGGAFRGERITSLEGLAGALAARTARAPWTLFVELKEESLRPFGRERMLAAVGEALGPIRRRCVLISFDPEVLRLARRDTRFPVGPVLRRRADWPRLRDRLRPEWVFADRRLVAGSGRLDRAFAGSRLVVYEVPDAGEARRLLARGAAAVETFRADTLAQELALWRGPVPAPHD